MNITFLGTGTSQGVPIIACKCPICQSTDNRDKRLRSSVMIELNDNTFIIDTGPDFRYQMLRESVSSIDAILLTHGHKDHVGGLDDVRAFNYILQRPVDVYCQETTKMAIEREFAYAFEENKYPGVPNINIHLIENKTFKINSIPITPIKALHYQLEVFGYRIGDFTYLTDCNHIPEEEMQKIEGSEIIVLNALRKQPHISHFNLSEALKVIEELNPKKAFLTHISHQMGLYKELENELPDNVHFAYDGLEINL